MYRLNKPSFISLSLQSYESDNYYTHSQLLEEDSPFLFEECKEGPFWDLCAKKPF
jgi:hypothetical protein